MKPKRYNLGFRAKALSVIVMAIACCFFIMWLGIAVADRVLQIHQAWESHNSRASLLRQESVHIERALGLGGFIHDFKKWIVQRDTKLIPEISRDLKRFDEAITRYRGLTELMPEEEQALVQLEDAVKKYRESFRLSLLPENNAMPALALEESVSVDDGQVVEAIGTLLAMQKARIDNHGRFMQTQIDEAVKLVHLSYALLPVVVLSVIYIIFFLRRTQLDAAQLEQARTYVDSVLEISPQPLLIIDEKGVIVRANRESEVLLRQHKRRLEGLSFESFIPKERRQAYIDFRERYFSDETLRAEAMLPTEAILETHGGYQVHVETALSSIELDGKCQAIATFYDLSQHKAAEETMLNARKMAEAANAMKSSFLANMSHEIRTPMNAILGMTHLVLKTQLTEKQRSYIQKSSDAAHSLLRLLDDIVDFSKIEAGKIVLESKPFNLLGSVKSVLNVVQISAQQKGITIRLDLQPVMGLVVEGDAFRLGQILMNLLSNAIKFTHHGGEVSLSIDKTFLPPSHVRLHFSVKDNGIGMTLEQQAEIFNAFEQAETSTTRRFGGSGLGLAISRQLVDLMDGDIQVESELGQGALFQFTAKFKTAQTLQLVEPDQHDVKPENMDQQAISKVRGKHFLLVDDVPINQEVALEILRDLGATCDLASNGREAIECVQQGEYDAVLMDCMMPVMDGYEATRKICSLPGRESLPIIAMTANAQAQDWQKAKVAGMSGLILKPIDVPTMVSVLASAINGAEEGGAHSTQ